MMLGRRERLVVLSADNRLRLHGIDVVSEGAADSAPVPIRELLAAVLRRDCSAFALAHHHPSGDPTPSKADRLATLAVDTEVRFRSPTERAAFSRELTEAVARLVSKYHDPSAPGGRAHRLVVVAHPLTQTSHSKEPS